MTVTGESEVHGPIDYILLEFPGMNLTGDAADALLDLVAQGVVRVYDLLVIRKHEDGSYSGVELSDLSSTSLGGFNVFAGATTGLLGEDDKAAAAGAMDPGTVAALIVYENTWAIPFVAAARGAGAQLVAGGRIPADIVMDALDELESVS
jgi:hypothetical protein